VDKHILFHELRDALRHDTCPICSIVENRIKKAINIFLHEGIGDAETRNAYIKAKGYCNYHAWKLREAGDPLAHAILYKELLEHHKRDIESYLEQKRNASSRNPSRSLSSLGMFRKKGRFLDGKEYLIKESNTAPKQCLLCVTVKDVEKRYLQSLPVFFEQDEQFKNDYVNRGVLCNPHLRKLVDWNEPSEALAGILEIQLGRLDINIDHLEEIQRKANYQHSYKEPGAERGGWIRAVNLYVGSPGIENTFEHDKV
jgi:hypothetical protein